MPEWDNDDAYQAMCDKDAEAEAYEERIRGDVSGCLYDALDAVRAALLEYELGVDRYEIFQAGIDVLEDAKTALCEFLGEDV